MIRYFAQRVALLVPTFVGITLVAFGMTRFVPGGPVDRLLLRLQDGADGIGPLASTTNLPPRALAALNHHFGLDVPWPVAYGRWLGALCTGDLGTSYKYGVPVSELLASRLPVSLYLGAAGFLLAYALCVPLGIWKAVRRGAPFDVASSVVILALYAVPGWALGGGLLAWLGSHGWVPLGGLRSPDWEALSWGGRAADLLRHTWLPVLAYTVTSFAALTTLTRNSVAEHLGQDYVRTALAKGVDRRGVVARHVWPNALVPLCAGIGRAVGALLAGSYLVERVFNLDGIGHLGYTALVDHDYTVVMGILALHAGLGLLGNVLADLLTAWADPRVRLDR